MRVTPDTKAKLDEAAKASGRSLSQEAKSRIEHSFNAGDAVFDALDLAYRRRWTGVLPAISTLAQITGTSAAAHSQWKFDSAEGWGRDPYAYDQVVQAINFLLEAFRPTGDPKPQTGNFDLPASAFERVGEGFARDLIEGLSNAAEKGPAWAFAYTSPAIRERVAGTSLTQWCLSVLVGRAPNCF